MKSKLLSVVVFMACGTGKHSANAKAPASKVGLASVSLFITVPASNSPARYVSSSTAAVTVTLDSVDGNAPAPGITTVATTSIAAGTCTSGCAVAAPDSPPGSDGFTITALDAQNNPLSSFTGVFTITAGIANQLTATLVAVATSLSIGTLPAATADTAFAGPVTVTVSVLDASGVAVTGTYDNAITLTDSDTSDLTLGSSLSVNGSAPATSVQIASSSDVVTLNYGGLAITPATLTASATAASNVTASFVPTLSALSYSGPEVSGAPTIDLFASSGAGASGSFSVSEAGWSDAPYSQVFTATADPSCSTIASVSSTDNLSFTVSAVAAPTAGTCTIAVTDGAGQSLSVAVRYTETQITIQ